MHEVVYREVVALPAANGKLVRARAITSVRMLDAEADCTDRREVASPGSSCASTPNAPRNRRGALSTIIRRAPSGHLASGTSSCSIVDGRRRLNDAVYFDSHERI